MILHVITGLGQGGAENALFRLIKNQADPTKHQVVSLSGGGPVEIKLRSIGVEVKCLGMRPGKLPNLRNLVKLFQIIKRSNASVVQTWMYHADLLGGIAARLAGAKVVWGIHHTNLDPQANKSTTLSVVRLNARLSKWIPHAIISCSQKGVNIHRLLGYADKFFFVPNGVSLTEFKFQSNPESARNSIKDINHLKSKRIIGHVSRADPLKDHETLLRAFSQLMKQQEDVALLLVGEGLTANSDYLEDLRKRVEPHISANITALGPRTDVHSLMQAMDVFVLSSSGEAFPNVLIEAMASGTPCVVTDVGDAGKIVGDTGWVCPVANSERIGYALHQALSESADEKILRRKAACERVESLFTTTHMVQGYQEVWSRVGK